MESALSYLIGIISLGNGVYQLLENVKKSMGDEDISNEEVLEELKKRISNNDLLGMYIEKIKNLNSIDASIINNIYNIKIEKSFVGYVPFIDKSIRVPTNFDKKYYIKEISKLNNENLKSIPYEFKVESIDKLISMKILSTDKRSISMNNSLFTELGLEIYKLIK